MTSPVVLSNWEVGTIPWRHPAGAPGIRVRTLWESARSRAVLLLIPAGASYPVHAHADEEHHAYVVQGTCRAGARDLTEGSYVHVPAGEPHDVCGSAPYGATVLYVFERDAR
jgi:quercetin dioxygenase-like cupin family protein